MINNVPTGSTKKSVKRIAIVMAISVIKMFQVEISLVTTFLLAGVILITEIACKTLDFLIMIK